MFRKFVEVKKIIPMLFVAALSINACTYNTEEELYPTDECNTVAMSLGTDISPILDNYSCNSCHSSTSNAGGVDLEGYTNLKIWVDNGRLLGSMKHDGATSPMPKAAPKMAQCDIDKVEAWITQGAQNN